MRTQGKGGQKTVKFCGCPLWMSPNWNILEFLNNSKFGYKNCVEYIYNIIANTRENIRGQFIVIQFETIYLKVHLIFRLIIQSDLNYLLP